jgi:hypothetical protein
MSSEKENVQKVSSMLNSFSFNTKEFCELMCHEHRTLQQSFTRLCIEWLCTCASDEYRYDGRNEASHIVAKALIESQDADFIGLPFI